MSWQDETCETCQFRVGSLCRHSPPNCDPAGEEIDTYRTVAGLIYARPVTPQSKKVEGFALACAQWEGA